MSTKVTSRLVRVAVLGAATIGTSLALCATPANAVVGILTAKLTVVGPYQISYYNVGVKGVVRFTNIPGSSPVLSSQVQAQRALDAGHKVVMRLWGEDRYFDDLLKGPFTASSLASPEGLEFTGNLKVGNAILDEDSDPLPNLVRDLDELYVGVRLLDSRGHTVRLGETNRVVRYF